MEFFLGIIQISWVNFDYNYQLRSIFLPSVMCTQNYTEATHFQVSGLLLHTCKSFTNITSITMTSSTKFRPWFHGNVWMLHQQMKQPCIQLGIPSENLRWHLPKLREAFFDLELKQTGRTQTNTPPLQRLEVVGVRRSQSSPAFCLAAVWYISEFCQRQKIVLSVSARRAPAVEWLHWSLQYIIHGSVVRITLSVCQLQIVGRGVGPGGGG